MHALTAALQVIFAVFSNTCKYDIAYCRSNKIFVEEFISVYLFALIRKVPTVIINVLFLVTFLFSWPFKSLDDNIFTTLSLVAITMPVFCALALNASTGAMGVWIETTSLGVLLGLLYAALVYHYWLPFICNHSVSGCIQDSWLKCLIKSSQLGQTFIFIFIFIFT